MSFPVFDILASRADLVPEFVAFEDMVSGERVSYCELNHRTGRTTALLSSCGVKHGDCVTSHEHSASRTCSITPC